MRYQTHHSFCPRGFSPPRQLPPHAACRFVAPYYRSKVRFVSPSCPRSLCPKTNADCLLCFPNRSFTPLEEFPSPVAALCLHSRCLPAVFTGCHSLLLAEAHNTRSLTTSRAGESRPLEIRTTRTEVLVVAHDNCRANHSRDSFRGCSHTGFTEVFPLHARRGARSAPPAAHQPKLPRTARGLAVNPHLERCVFVEPTPPSLRLPTLAFPQARFSVPRSGVFNSKALLHR